MLLKAQKKLNTAHCIKYHSFELSQQKHEKTGSDTCVLSLPICPIATVRVRHALSGSSAGQEKT